MTSKLEYPFKAPLTPAILTEVSEDIFWLRLPLPFALNHINVWLLRDHDNWALIDTGINTGETKKVWLEILGNVISPDKIKTIFCSHFHPDHFGLAGWLANQQQAEFYCSKKEWDIANHLVRDSKTEYVTKQNLLYKKHGIHDSWVMDPARKTNTYRQSITELPASYNRIQDGETLSIHGQSWQVITVHGHSPEQTCLYNSQRNLFISADQVLPNISPNVSLGFHNLKEDPLNLFIESLQNLDKRIDSSALVLPSHGLPFQGISDRIDALISHHEERLEVLLQACQKPRTAASLLPILFNRELDDYQIGFAMGECLSHLKYLENKGLIYPTTQNDGVIDYRQYR